MRKLLFPLARPGHDATVKLLFLAKEHPLALPVVDFVAVLIKLDVDSAPQINGREESRAVGPISAQRLLLKRLALPAHFGKRLRLSSLMVCQLTDDDVGSVTEALKRIEVADLLPDSHPTLDEVALVPGVVAEEDDVTSRYNAPPRQGSADTPGRNRRAKVGIQATIHDIVVDLLISAKDAQIVGVGQEFLLFLIV